MSHLLAAVSSVDGRYAEKTQELKKHFSENALVQYRINIELAWLETVLPLLNPSLLNPSVQQALAAIGKEAAAPDTFANVKQLEAQTKHDVKAVEYWIGEQLQKRDLSALRPYVHFACTSWDINNIAFTLQLTGAVHDVMLPALTAVLQTIDNHAAATAALPMLARTHGQPASPTTMGKEFANVSARIAPRLARLAAIRLPAKFNGAVGNYNAHVIAAADIDWLAVTRQFVEQYQLSFARYTTQIEPYDDLAELFDLLRRINTILLDLCRDCWGYISMDYFIQSTDGKKEAGSSTMPHKINPIDFENAEGNIGIANALLVHFADKLPVSRWQRDLSDSTVLRTVGTAFAHTLIAWKAVNAGLNKITPNHHKLAADLDNNWSVLTEAVQIVLRTEGIEDAYEQLKALSRGHAVNADSLHAYINSLTISDDAKKRLLQLTPAQYCGLAATLAAREKDQ